jgi:hypothetical protein
MPPTRAGGVCGLLQPTKAITLATRMPTNGLLIFIVSLRGGAGTSIDHITWPVDQLCVLPHSPPLRDKFARRGLAKSHPLRRVGTLSPPRSCSLSRDIDVHFGAAVEFGITINDPTGKIVRARTGLWSIQPIIQRPGLRHCDSWNHCFDDE